MHPASDEGAGDPVLRTPEETIRRLVWLAALGVLAVMMAVFIPYVLRTASTWQAVAWLVMLAGTVVFIAALIRAERLVRHLDRQPDSDVSSPTLIGVGEDRAVLLEDGGRGGGLH
ncbi:hypothetical protein ACH4FX_40495 [Streptomyces sp. NPDC018019]|uniref:hypothetical protein n=1 Tax=Streptomyces sp. NPDC018019 TaxID=3365030 RepID=UPI0037BDCE6E